MGSASALGRYVGTGYLWDVRFPTGIFINALCRDSRACIGIVASRAFAWL